MELSAAEIGAIRDYSDKGYERMNQQLREHAVTPQMARKINLLNAALAALPPVRGDVYRGTVIHDLAVWRSIAPLARRSSRTRSSHPAARR
ncbi:MAG: hypothetical protein ABR526_06595 [Chthoniobacterales bacterium]